MKKSMRNRAVLTASGRSVALTASLLSLALMAVGCGSDTEANSTDTGEILTGDALVAAAKDECDSLTWYGASEPKWMEEVSASFEKDYGIRVEWAEANSGELTSRVMTETQTGGTKADVITVPDSVMASFADHDILRPYNSVNLDKIDPAIVESLGKYKEFFTPVQLDAVGIIYNTKNISAADAPKSWKELADERWQGQLAAPDPRVSTLYSGTIAFLEKTLGWDYVAKLGSKLRRTTGSGDSQALMLTGEKNVVAYAAFSVAVFALHENEDTPIGLVAPEEGLLVSTFGSSVTKSSECVHGAQLLINYTIEQKIQELVPEYGYYPAVSSGVESPKELPDLDKVKWSPLDWQEVANPDRHKEIADHFDETSK